MDYVPDIISSNKGFFLFVAARQLMEFLCSVFDESGILYIVGGSDKTFCLIDV